MRLAIAITILGAGSALASFAKLPRAFGVVQELIERSDQPHLQVRQEHDHEHYNVILPTACVDQCRSMVRLATQIETATILRNTTQQTAICTSANITPVVSCINCAVGAGVPNLSREDAGESIEFFTNYCRNVTAANGVATSITATRTATGPYTTLTNVHIPEDFDDYPLIRTGTGASTSTGARSTGSPTAAASSTASVPASATSAAAAASSRAAGHQLGVPGFIGAVAGAAAALVL